MVGKVESVELGFSDLRPHSDTVTVIVILKYPNRFDVFVRMKVALLKVMFGRFFSTLKIHLSPFSFSPSVFQDVCSMLKVINSIYVSPIVMDAQHLKRKGVSPQAG